MRILEGGMKEVQTQKHKVEFSIKVFKTFFALCSISGSVYYKRIIFCLDRIYFLFVSRNFHPSSEKMSSNVMTYKTYPWILLVLQNLCFAVHLKLLRLVSSSWYHHVSTTAYFGKVFSTIFKQLLNVWDLWPNYIFNTNQRLTHPMKASKQKFIKWMKN